MAAEHIGQQPVLDFTARAHASHAQRWPQGTKANWASPSMHTTHSSVEEDDDDEAADGVDPAGPDLGATGDGATFSFFAAFARVGKAVALESSSEMSGAAGDATTALKESGEAAIRDVRVLDSMEPSECVETESASVSTRAGATALCNEMTMSMAASRSPLSSSAPTAREASCASIP